MLEARRADDGGVVTPTIPTSAARETPWARALRDALERHGPTPTFDAVAADLGYVPTVLTAATETAGLLLDGGES